MTPEQFQELRRILLMILYHTINAEASTDYTNNQLGAAGATVEDLKMLGIED